MWLLACDSEVTGVDVFVNRICDTISKIIRIGFLQVRFQVVTEAL